MYNNVLEIIPFLMTIQHKKMNLTVRLNKDIISRKIWSDFKQQIIKTNDFRNFVFFIGWAIWAKIEQGSPDTDIIKNNFT